MLTDNPGLKSYKEAGFKFVYIVHSTKEPTKILYQDSFFVYKIEELASFFQNKCLEK